MDKSSRNASNTGCSAAQQPVIVAKDKTSNLSTHTRMYHCPAVKLENKIQVERRPYLNVFTFRSSRNRKCRDAQDILKINSWKLKYAKFKIFSLDDQLLLGWHSMSGRWEIIYLVRFTGAAHASADKIVEASTTSTKNLCNNINVVPHLQLFVESHCGQTGFSQEFITTDCNSTSHNGSFV